MYPTLAVYARLFNYISLYNIQCILTPLTHTNLAFSTSKNLSSSCINMEKACFSQVYNRFSWLYTVHIIHMKVEWLKSMLFEVMLTLNILIIKFRNFERKLLIWGSTMFNVGLFIFKFTKQPLKIILCIMDNLTTYFYIYLLSFLPHIKDFFPRGERELNNVMYNMCTQTYGV